MRIKAAVEAIKSLFTKLLVSVPSTMSSKGLPAIPAIDTGPLFYVKRYSLKETWSDGLVPDKWVASDQCNREELTNKYLIDHDFSDESVADFIQMPEVGVTGQWIKVIPLKHLRVIR